MDKAPDAYRTISEVAEELDLPQHVLRFWETRFAQIKPLKRGGGRRYYRPDDIDFLKGIRQLLYGQGFTIRGVQRIIKDNGVKNVQAIGRGEASVPPPKPGGPEVVAKGGSELDTAHVEIANPLHHAEGSVPLGSSTAQAAPIAVNGTHANGAPEPASTDQRVRLSPNDLALLQKALGDLGECRRRLDEVLKAR